MTGSINISNRQATITEIDVEGVIGLPEGWQFENDEDKVATYEKFKAIIDSLKGIKTPKIVVNIRSTGGNVNDAMLIHDTLLALDAQITTRCYGYVASAATIIAQAASVGNREISANALYLIHRCVSSSEGNSESMSQTIDLLNKTDQAIANIYAQHSVKDIEHFMELMSRNGGNGVWLSPQQALENALVDRIIESKPITNNMNEEIALLGLPALPNSPAPAPAPTLPTPPSATLPSPSAPDSQETIKPNDVDNSIHPTKNKITMNLKKQWIQILNILGLSPETEDEITESDLKQINNELTIRAQKIKTLSDAATSETCDSPNGYKHQIAELENKIVELEAQNRRLSAFPTATKPKEDPTITEQRYSQNQIAYLNDAQIFK